MWKHKHGQPNMGGWNWLLAILIVGAFVGVTWVATQYDQAAPRRAVVASPRAYSLPLIDTSGGTISLNHWQGRWIVLSFGFTHCPDICPATLAYLAKELKLIDRSGDHFREQIQGIFVGIDTINDRPEVLGPFVRRFDPTFIGVTGSSESIKILAKEYGGFVDQESVNHSSGFFIIGPQGQLVDLLSLPAEEGALVKKLERVIVKNKV